MSIHEIVRAWKDEEFRLSLSDEQRALLPAHPAGPVQLDDAELDQAAGGRVQGRTEILCTYRCWPQ